VAPDSICAFNSSSCPAGTGESRVELTANPTGGPVATWPAVQVVFVIETTSYDGVLGTDRSDSLDACAAQSDTAPACEESNAVPFFVANAQTIANSIQDANPHSAVSFALVDYYDARGEPWDDADGPEYEVDIGEFVPADQFGPLVSGTFQQNVMGGLWYSWDQDLDNNFLDSSSITALYGAIVGSQLNWTPSAHHVIVWMGSSAPRDPHYSENYCVSPSEWNVWDNPPPPCQSMSCEPSWPFATGYSPTCEGWIDPQDGSPNDSIARLAHTAPSCTDSIGGVCTIDMIDLWTTTTDPYSEGWPAQFTKIGGGPGGSQVLQNTERVLQAGCDMAEATGGTWNGPAFFTCSDGQAGTLQYVPFGNSIDTPNTNNPYLFRAFQGIGFGPVYGSIAARGADRPIFTFVPFGAIAVAPQPQWSVACATPTGFSPKCQEKPTIVTTGGVTSYGWNWSTNATNNTISLGDEWAASFNIVATGPPYARVPVDACLTINCKAAGSGAIAGFYTVATYESATSPTVIETSFPLAEISVEVNTYIPSAPSSPPPLIPPLGGLPIPIAPVIPIAAPLPVLAQVGLGTLSLNAAAAGFLGAGFTAVGMRNRPIAMSIASRSGAGIRPKADPARNAPLVGRLE
jgi:hypothetical protein